MSDMLASLTGPTLGEATDPRVTALKDLLEKRPKARDTNTNAYRSKAIILLQALAADFPKDVGFDDLWPKLAEAWSGEGGWDRQTIVDALGRDRQAIIQGQPQR